jgi:hypothetical protein
MVELFNPRLHMGIEAFTRDREREGEKERGNGEVVRNTTFRESKKGSIFPVLKVPRQCPLVLRVEAAHMIGIQIFNYYYYYYYLFLYNAGQAAY